MTQLDRIEAKLDWLRWRIRWGEIGELVYDDDDKEHGLPIGAKLIEQGPEPTWPEAK